VLVVIDGAKALRKAVHDVLGSDTPVQRWARHKERNVVGHLPDRDRPLVRRRLRPLEDPAAALDRLQQLAGEPRALASRRGRVGREGLAET
jgi:putative transposase